MPPVSSRRRVSAAPAPSCSSSSAVIERGDRRNPGGGSGRGSLQCLDRRKENRLLLRHVLLELGAKLRGRCGRAPARPPGGRGRGLRAPARPCGRAAAAPRAAARGSVRRCSALRAGSGASASEVSGSSSPRPRAPPRVGPAAGRQAGPSHGRLRRATACRRSRSRRRRDRRCDWWTEIGRRSRRPGWTGRMRSWGESFPLPRGSPTRCRAPR